MVEPTGTAELTALHVGEGEFPVELDRVNFGAFLLAFLWAPAHRLWGWFAVFAALETLESAMGLSAPGFLGGVFERPAVMIGFRVVYWSATVVFALRANRLAWRAQQKLAARATRGGTARRRALVSKYASNQRVWALVGIVLLVGTPLSLLVSSVRSVPGAAQDVAVTVGTQAVLLVGLWLYDRSRVAHIQTREGRT